MPTLTKISEIKVFVTMTTQEALQEIFDCKRLLESNNIPYTNMIYNDDSQLNDIYHNLGTWLFGLDLTPRTFTSFPIVTWLEYYDDNENFYVQVAQSFAEFQSSNIVAYKDLVVA